MRTRFYYLYWRQPTQPTQGTRAVRYAAFDMRLALPFNVLFISHVGCLSVETFSSGPGGCSALSGHCVGATDDPHGY